MFLERGGKKTLLPPVISFAIFHRLHVVIVFEAAREVARIGKAHFVSYLRYTLVGAKKEFGGLFDTSHTHEFDRRDTRHSLDLAIELRAIHAHRLCQLFYREVGTAHIVDDALMQAFGKCLVHLVQFRGHTKGVGREVVAESAAVVDKIVQSGTEDVGAKGRVFKIRRIFCLLY